MRLFRYVNAVLGDITNMPAIRDRSVVKSSVMPSAKYCCSGSLLRLAKGRTTMDRRGAATNGEREVVDDPLAAGTSAVPSERNAKTRTGRAMFFTLCSPMSWKV